MPRIDPTAYVDADAQLIGDVVVGPEASIWRRSVLRAKLGSILIGDRSCVLDGAIIESGGGTQIGRDCVVGPSATLTGVQLEDATFVGAGAILADGCCVKTGGMVAEGAVLASRLMVPPGFRAEGHPAELKAIGDVTDGIRKQALKYRDMSARYRAAVVHGHDQPG